LENDKKRSEVQKELLRKSYEATIKANEAIKKFNNLRSEDPSNALRRAFSDNND